MTSSISMSGSYPMLPMHHAKGAPDPGRAAQDLISKADTDGNGSISKSELSTMIEGMGSSLAGGSVSSDTLSGLFEQIDSDSDAQLSSAEISEVVNGLFEQMEMARGAMPPPSPPPGDPSQMFSDADADGSGGLDATEFTSMLQNGPMANASESSLAELFSQADSDGDGVLSQEELKASMPPPPPHHGEEGRAQQAGNEQDPLAPLINSLISQYLNNQSAETETTSVSLTA